MTKDNTMRKTTIAMLAAASFLLAACGGGTSSEERAAERAEVSESKAAEKAERTSAAAASSEAAAAKAAPQAAAIEDELLSSFGASSFSEILASDSSMWAGYIADVSVDGNKAVVTLQVDRQSAEGKAMGERAAKALSTLLTSSVTEGLSWIVVQDGAGVVIDQAQLAPLA